MDIISNTRISDILIFHEIRLENMEPILSFTAVALLIIGLIGQGFELRKIRTSVVRDEDLSSVNMFTNKRNLKWYVLIGAGLVLWYAGNSSPR